MEEQLKRLEEITITCQKLILHNQVLLMMALKELKVEDIDKKCMKIAEEIEKSFGEE